MQLELPLDLTPVTAPTGTQRYIQLGGEIVVYRFRRARRRSIGLVIDDNGLRVAAPVRAPIAEVEAFIREKAQWVLKKIAEWRTAPRLPVVSWSDGAMIAFLGAQIVIELVPGRRDIGLQEGRLGIGLVPSSEPAALRKRGIAWLKDRARTLIR
ncbi:MAG: YgjP-like metallopeptidase domain-containing protein [Pseudomonadota bacterium]